MPTYGYDAGQPFGDPNQFTRSTQESEIDRFNQWLRSQPYWQQIQAQRPESDFSDAERAQLNRELQQRGIQVPDAFGIDKAGNFNQTNRLDDYAKWSAIAAGAALTGGGLMGVGPLAGALGGGAGAAGAAGGVLPSTTIGAGYIGPIAGGTGLAGLGGGAAAATGGALASSMIGDGMMAGLPAGGSGISTAGMLSSGMAPSTLGNLAGEGKSGGSWVDKLLGKGGDKSDALGNLGDMFNTYANDEARNRVQRGNFAQAYDRTRLMGREDDRDQESDAIKKLAQTSYLASGGAKPLPTHVNSGNLPDLGFGPRPASDAQKQAATNLQGTLLNRTTPAGQFQPVPFDSYAKAGTGENIGRYGNYATAAGSVIKDLFF